VIVTTTVLYQVTIQTKQPKAVDIPIIDHMQIAAALYFRYTSGAYLMPVVKVQFTLLKYAVSLEE